jgi:hypothetical protein
MPQPPAEVIENLSRVSEDGRAVLPDRESSL